MVAAALQDSPGPKTSAVFTHPDPRVEQRLKEAEEKINERHNNLLMDQELLRREALNRGLPETIANDVHALVQDNFVRDSSGSHRNISSNLIRLGGMASAEALKRYPEGTMTDAQAEALARDMLKSEPGTVLMEELQSKAPSGLWGGAKAATGIGASAIGGAAKGGLLGLVVAAPIMQLFKIPAGLIDKAAGTNLKSQLTVRNAMFYGTLAFAGLGMYNKAQSKTITPLLRNQTLSQTSVQAVKNMVIQSQKARAAERNGQATTHEQEVKTQNANVARTEEKVHDKEVKEAAKPAAPAPETGPANENLERKANLSVVPKVTHEQFLKDMQGRAAAGIDLTQAKPKGYESWEAAYKATVGKDMPNDALTLLGKGTKAAEFALGGIQGVVAQNGQLGGHLAAAQSAANLASRLLAETGVAQGSDVKDTRLKPALSNKELADMKAAQPQPENANVVAFKPAGATR